MKKRTTFDYDEKNGLMIAQLRTGGKTYFGTAAKHPDDPFPPSYSIGEKIAEARAYKNFYADKIEEKKIELKGLERLLAAMPVDATNRHYVKNLYRAICYELADLKAAKHECDERINIAIESRSIYIRSRTGDKKAKKEYLDKLGKSLKELNNIKTD